MYIHSEIRIKNKLQMTELQMYRNISQEILEKKKFWKFNRRYQEYLVFPYKEAAISKIIT